MTLEGKPFIVWTGGDYDGWSPNEFDTAEEALSFIASGSTFSPFVITRRLGLAITELPGEEGNWGSLDD